MPPEELTDMARIDILDKDHHEPFQVGLRRILQTEVAEFTYAQIIDGLPTRDSYEDQHWPQDGHPALEHEDLCLGALERAGQFKSEFDMNTLNVPLPVSSESRI